MPEVRPVTLDATQEDLILQAQILPRPPLLSSQKFGWEGINVQHHRQPSWEVPKYSLAEITKQLKRPLVHLDTST